jgi:hypothetical protein
MVYWGVEVWLLNVLEYFSIALKYSLEVLTGRLILKKERQINKHRVLSRLYSSLGTDSTKTRALHKESRHLIFIVTFFILCIFL